MSAQGRLINVRVDAETAAAIDRRLKQEGGTVSDVVRNLIDRGLGLSSTTNEKALTARYNADALEQLSSLATTLRRLGSAYVYSLKARVAVGAAEEQARLNALDAVEAAARRLVK